MKDQIETPKKNDISSKNMSVVIKNTPELIRKKQLLRLMEAEANQLKNKIETPKKNDISSKNMSVVIKNTPELIRKKQLLRLMEAEANQLKNQIETPKKTRKLTDETLFRINTNRVKRQILDDRYEILRDERYALISTKELLKHLDSNNFKQKFNTNFKAYQAINQNQLPDDKRDKTTAILQTIDATIKRYIANKNKLDRFKEITKKKQLSKKAIQGYNNAFEKKIDHTVFKGNIVYKISVKDVSEGRQFVETIVYDYLRNLPKGIYQIKYTPKRDDYYGIIDPVIDVQIDTSKKTSSELYTELETKMTLNSEISIPDYYNNEGSLFIMKPTNIIRANKRHFYNNQYFLDASSFHCFFKPIQDHFFDLYQNSLDKSKKTQDNYKSKVKTVLRLTEEYKNGVNRADIQLIVNKLQIGAIEFVNMFDNTHVYEKFTGNLIKGKIFKYFNSRTNHLENKLFNLNEISYVENFDILKLKYQELKDNGILFYHKKGVNGIVEIYTQECIYKVKDYDDTIKLFRDYKETFLSDKYINKTVDSELSNFVEKSLHFLGAIDFTSNRIGGKQSLWYKNENHPVIGHIDQQKAYYNIDKCSYYEGMLGKISDFRKTHKIESIGLYRIYDIDYTNCNNKFKFYCYKLNFLINNNIYSSPLLKYVSDQGIKYKISEGCWGEKFDMKLPETFLEKPNPNNYNGVKRPALYSVFIGSLAQIHPTYNIYIGTDKDSADVICRQEFRNDDFICSFDEVSNEYCVSIPNKQVRHLSQITSFVTSYTAINTLEQLMDMNENSVIRVVADGIYYLRQNYTKDKIKVNIENLIDDFEGEVEVDDNLEYVDEIVNFKNIFRNEDGNHFGTNNHSKSYFSNILVEDNVAQAIGEYKEHFPITLYEGVGGTGKSYSCLTDEGALGKMYFAPSKKLKRNKSIEFKDKNILGFYTVQKLLRLSTDPEKSTDRVHTYILKYGRNLYIDECSMLNEEQKNHLISIFKPLSIKLHFMGDIGYQLRPITGQIMSKTNIDKIITLTHNYRVTDSKLLDFIYYLRNIMTNKEYDDHTLAGVLKYINKTFELVNKNKLMHDFQIDDYIITWTNLQADSYDVLVKDKFIDDKKYFIIKGDKLSYETGDIIKKNEPLFPNCEFIEKYGFTTHKLQGETLESFIYIDIKNMLSVPSDSRDLFYELLHTAVGRVHRASQIKFII